MNALERLREANRADVILPSGLVATIRLPRIRDCIIAGGLPLPAISKLEDAAKRIGTNGDAPQLTTEDMAAAGRFNDEIVRASVVALDGEVVTLTLEDVGLFTEDDYNAIVSYGTRVTPLPFVKAATD